MNDLRIVQRMPDVMEQQVPRVSAIFTASTLQTRLSLYVAADPSLYIDDFRFINLTPYDRAGELLSYILHIEPINLLTWGGTS
jgi:hypothetical protein